MSRNILFGLLTVLWLVQPAQGRFLIEKQAKHSPRPRIACLPHPALGTRYTDPCDLGPHRYHGGWGERTGIVYTCHGGHVDIAHLRKGADWTAYLAYHVREALLKNQPALRFKMHEPAIYHARFRYPDGWEQLPAEVRRLRATDAAIVIGQYLSFVGNTWHEILTWFGFKSTAVYPEFSSSFSWEDTYSNVLGCVIAERAMRDPNRPYDEAMTAAIEGELERLGVQPKGTAKAAAERVRGQWFTSTLVFCSATRRHLDIGWDDGFVTPWLIPGVAGCEVPSPHLCPVADLGRIERHGFGMDCEIEPKEWEKGRILKAAYSNESVRGKRIEPAKHFGPIMAQVRAEAIKKYGPGADEPNVSPRASARGAP